jgi:hypothetical protein
MGCDESMGSKKEKLLCSIEKEDDWRWWDPVCVHNVSKDFKHSCHTGGTVTST